MGNFFNINVYVYMYMYVYVYVYVYMYVYVHVYVSPFLIDLLRSSGLTQWMFAYQSKPGSHRLLYCKSWMNT